MAAAPGLVSTPEQLAAEVANAAQFDHFVLDVETTFAPHASVNEVLWVGLAVPNRVTLIPIGHPNGHLVRPAQKMKLLPPRSERKVLKDGTRSLAKKSVTVPAVFGEPPAQLRADVVFEALEPLLFSDRTKIGHNLKFDLQSVAKYYGGKIPPGPYSDTMIMTQVIDENLISYSLKEVVMDWLRVPHGEARKSFYPNLGRQGVEKFSIDDTARYLAKDVWYTLLLHQALSRSLAKGEDLQAVYANEMDVLPVLMDMEMRGVAIDMTLLRLKGNELIQERDASAGKIWSIVGEQYPLTQTDKTRAYLFNKKKDGGQGLRPLSYTAKTNTPQLNQAMLEYYAPTNELAAELLVWSEKEKMVGTFVTGLNEKIIKGRLHTSFNQHRTVTGRLSSSQPNLQQIPRGEHRDIFIADPGYSLVVADYDQVELRCAAFLSEDPEMMRVFTEGLDIHASAAASMLGIPVEDVTKDQRQVGKTQNFGTLYGAGPQKVADVAGVDLDMANEFIDRYYQQFAGLDAWKEQVLVDARRRGSRKHGRTPYASIPPLGRRRRLPDLYLPYDVRGNFGAIKRAERQVVNSIVQGFAAIIMKIALIDLAGPNGSLLGTPYQLLLNVHDEVIIQAPEAEAEEAQRLLVTTMEGVTYDGAPILGSVPLTADGGIARSWNQAK